MKRLLAIASITIMAAFSTTTRAADPDIKLALDTSKTREPISKYIYGQFIEHLGKSIYGGLWAEMIEDRKFAHPINDTYDPMGTDHSEMWHAGDYQYLKASPWKVIGPPGTVTMDKEKPFVGDHTPVIHLKRDGTAAGIAQGGFDNSKPLAMSLVKGKKYVGHIVLAGDAEVGPVTVTCSASQVADIPLPARNNFLLVSHDGYLTFDLPINGVTGEFVSYPLLFESPVTSDNVTLSITAKGKGTFKIGAISLMPADNIKGWRADTVAVLKQLDAPIYRWPGGNFVSGYNWRDGIDPNPDKRPPRKNPAWHNIEANDVGIHEFMELCDILKTEPYVALNTGKGSVEECAAEVQYIVGGPDTPMGKLRAANGRKEPWKENYWAVGNEMYGTWQLGYMPLADYEKKHNAAATLIRAEDPTGILVACGDTPTKGWDTGMLTNCGDNMNLLSLHTYVKEIPEDPAKHAAQLRDSIRHIADSFRAYKNDVPGLAGKNIKVAFDEWNFWYGDYLYGELGCQYHLKDALGVAMGLHEFYRNSDIMQIACFAQTVNVLGAVKTSRTAAILEGSGEVLALYRHHYGTLPINLTQPTPDLDIAAAWTDDKKAITISIINPTPNARQVVLDLGKLAVKDAGTQWEIAGTDPQAHNEPGKPAVITAQEKKLTFNNTLAAPAFAAELYRLELK